MWKIISYNESSSTLFRRNKKNQWHSQPDDSVPLCKYCHIYKLFVFLGYCIIRSWILYSAHTGKNSTPWLSWIMWMCVSLYTHTLVTGRTCNSGQYLTYIQRFRFITVRLRTVITENAGYKSNIDRSYMWETMERDQNKLYCMYCNYKRFHALYSKKNDSQFLIWLYQINNVQVFVHKAKHLSNAYNAFYKRIHQPYSQSIKWNDCTNFKIKIFQRFSGQ